MIEEIEIKDERKLRRKDEEKIGCNNVVMFTMMIYISFLFKILRVMKRISIKIGFR